MPRYFEVCSTNSSSVQSLSETPAAMAGVYKALPICRVPAADNLSPDFRFSPLGAVQLDVTVFLEIPAIRDFIRELEKHARVLRASYPIATGFSAISCARAWTLSGN